MEVKSTLKVFNEADFPAAPGIWPGQTQKALAGSPEHPSERIWVRLALFKAGTSEDLHWHLIEAFYFVLSGRALMTDIEGKTYDIRPGTVIYAPPGIAGSHSWEFIEPLHLMAIRATTDPEKTVEFVVDRSTMESSIDLELLAKKQAVNFKKSLY